MPRIKLKKYSRRDFITHSFVMVTGATRIKKTTPKNEDTTPISELCLDVNNNKILLQEYADLVRSPASLVKMMLMYLVAQKVNTGKVELNEIVKVKKTIYPQNMMDIIIASDKEYQLSWLMDAIAIISSNTSAELIAQTLWKSKEECIQEMNDMAKKLGMKSTVYHTVNGYPVKSGLDLDKTTANDISILAKECCKYPLILSWTSKKKLILEKEGIERDNTNELLFLTVGCDGIKTGYTKSAGHCIVATAKRANKRLISVVLGAKKSSERFRIANNLLEIGFAEIE
ncbi:MAG TPA: serine hydrolase [Candidatus Hydrogenedens sp.]|nr:serine hydrolase [Candidatus Hydrogenedens sp.]HPP59448.1 serine hydrolase [Candidatus Hydrogenedens sp.]